MADLPPVGNRPILARTAIVRKAGWAEGLHPRASGGRFAQSSTARARRRRRRIHGHEHPTEGMSLALPLTTITSPDPGFAGSLQGWVRRIVAAGIPTPDGTIEFRPERYDDFAPAVTLPPDGPTYMGVAEVVAVAGSTRAGWAQVQGNFFLELGHHFDYRMPDWARSEFLRITGQAGRPWRDPPNSPHEQFAEAYRAVIVAALGGPRQTELAFGLNLGGGRFGRVRRLIQRAGRAQVQPRP